jgi:uncharacterized membrane-anchored protein
MKNSIVALVVTCALTWWSPPVSADDSQPTNQQDAQAAFRKQVEALGWIRGPKKVQLFDNSTLQLPQGYLFLNPTDTAKLQALQHNLPGATQYFLAPEDFRWQVFFSFSSDGYVKDDEKIDANALLKSIEANTAEGNKVRREKGWDEMEVVGWQTPPHYDTQTNRLEWAIDGKNVRTNDVVVNFNTRLLGRGGVMSAVLITAPDSLAPSIAEFKGTLNGFEYVPGQRYAEYKPGDKIAKYGLAALVTGGAAAIAVKTGLWKVIVGAVAAGWKFIAAGAVALFGAISRRFKRKA